MKKRRVLWLSLVVVLISSLVAGTALAQQRPKRVISLTGIGLVQLYEEEVGLTSGLFRGAVGLEYEKVRSASSSFYMVPAISFGGGAMGIRGRVGMKNYTNATAPEGFWWGYYLDAGIAVDWGIALTLGGAGLNVGYKYFLPKNFTAEWSLGMMYLYRSEGLWPAVGGIAPSVGFKVGYAF